MTVSELKKVARSMSTTVSAGTIESNRELYMELQKEAKAKYERDSKALEERNKSRSRGGNGGGSGRKSRIDEEEEEEEEDVPVEKCSQLLQKLVSNPDWKSTAGSGRQASSPTEASVASSKVSYPTNDDPEGRQYLRRFPNLAGNDADWGGGSSRPGETTYRCAIGVGQHGFLHFARGGRSGTPLLLVQADSPGCKYRKAEGASGGGGGQRRSADRQHQ